VCVCVCVRVHVCVQIFQCNFEKCLGHPIVVHLEIIFSASVFLAEGFILKQPFYRSSGGVGGEGHNKKSVVLRSHD